MNDTILEFTALEFELLSWRKIKMKIVYLFHIILLLSHVCVVGACMCAFASEYKFN